MAGSSTVSSMGGLSFSGNDAFPNATQAAFGGMGGAGFGVGYGGQSSGASISFVPSGAPAQAAAVAAAKPSGLGGMDPSGLIVIAGVILAVILVVAMIGSKEHHGRRR